MGPVVGSPFPSPTVLKGRGDAASCFWRWDSPLPYLFGGLAALMGLITVALIILACSSRKSSSSAEDPEACSSDERRLATAPMDVKPSVLVIMAGEDVPSFLAKAVPSPKQITSEPGMDQRQ